MHIWLRNAGFETKLWGNLLNIRKETGGSRFEFEIGFSVEASVEFYITSSFCIEKRSKLLKEMMDRHEIYSNKKPPPQKRAAKCSFCGREVGNLQNIGRKSKNAGLSPGLNLLLNFLFNSDLCPFSIFVEKIKQSNNKKSKKGYLPANSDFEA